MGVMQTSGSVIPKALFPTNTGEMPLHKISSNAGFMQTTFFYDVEFNNFRDATSACAKNLKVFYLNEYAPDYIGPIVVRHSNFISIDRNALI